MFPERNFRRCDMTLETVNLNAANSASEERCSSSQGDDHIISESIALQNFEFMISISVVYSKSLYPIARVTLQHYTPIIVKSNRSVLLPGPRRFSIIPSKMANIPTEIPSLKLNDGTSIPMVRLHISDHDCSSLKLLSSSATAVSSRISSSDHPPNLSTAASSSRYSMVQENRRRQHRPQNSRRRQNSH